MATRPWCHHWGHWLPAIIPYLWLVSGCVTVAGLAPVPHSWPRGRVGCCGSCWVPGWPHPVTCYLRPLCPVSRPPSCSLGTPGSPRSWPSLLCSHTCKVSPAGGAGHSEEPSVDLGGGLVCEPTAAGPFLRLCEGHPRARLRGCWHCFSIRAMGWFPAGPLGQLSLMVCHPGYVARGDPLPGPPGGLCRCVLPSSRGRAGAASSCPHLSLPSSPTLWLPSGCPVASVSVSPQRLLRAGTGLAALALGLEAGPK